MSKLDELAEYYGSHDTTAEMESGHWETSEPQKDPMVTTSLRLPKSLLDQVREQASSEDLKATVWIRRAIEVRLTDPVPKSTEARLRRLEDAVFKHSA